VLQKIAAIIHTCYSPIMRILILLALLALTADAPALTKAQSERIIAAYLEETTLRQIVTVDPSVTIRCGTPMIQQREKVQEAIKSGTSPIYIAKMVR